MSNICIINNLLIAFHFFPNAFVDITFSWWDIATEWSEQSVVVLINRWFEYKEIRKFPVNSLVWIGFDFVYYNFVFLIHNNYTIQTALVQDRQTYRLTETEGIYVTRRAVKYLIDM